MANVRFYRLPALPVWDATKYKGIFVHIEDSKGDGEFNPFAEGNGSIETKVNGYKVWQYGSTKSNNETIGLYWINDERGASEEIKTFETNDGTIKGRFTYMGGGYVCTGLWFGGSFGWELLTNDTDVNYINQLIDSKINALDVDTVDTVISNASSGTGTVLTFKGVKEVDGKIQQGEGTSTITIGDGALKISGYGETTSGVTPSIPTVTDTDVFSANDTADSTIALSNAFVFNSTNKTIGIRTKTAVSATNNIVTETDIASLAGAMHYKGTLTNAQSGEGSWPSTVAAGDVYIVTVGHTHGSDSLEVGDMVVFGSTTTSDYKIIQSNLTLGVSNGQVAKNDGDLSANKIVIATANGIQTTTYTVGSGSNASSRAQSIADDTADAASIIHGTTETDSIEILGKTNSKTLKIASSNASVEVKKNGNSEIDIDLVWNTHIS